MANMAGKVVKQLAGSGTGQSLMDRMNAAMHTVSGSGLGKSVCKATTEEIAAPKKKHLEYLIQCTNEPNVSIPDMADFLMTRCQHTSWVVVFKALISTHHLMNLGNDRFSQYIASNNIQFSLPNFTDKTTAQAYDMSMFIRKYSCYVSEKVESYRLMAFDFCKVKRGKDGVLRTIAGDKLLKAVPVLQKQLDVLLGFEASTSELTNQVINAAFMLLYKDLIRLFASYNEGMINLIERYFSMTKKQCKDGLGLYKNFLQRMEKVTGFLKTAETMGIGEKESLGLQAMPESVWDAMEQHLATLEGRKYVKTSPYAVPETPAASTSPSQPQQTNASQPVHNSAPVAVVSTVEITLNDTPAQEEAPDTSLNMLDDIVAIPESERISESQRQRMIEEQTQRMEEFSEKSNAAAQRSSSPFEVPSGSGVGVIRVQQKPVVSRVITTASSPVGPPQHHDEFADFSHSAAANSHTPVHAAPQPSPAKVSTPVVPTPPSQTNQDLLLLGFDDEPTPSTARAPSPTPAAAHVPASSGWGSSSAGANLMDVDFGTTFHQASPAHKPAPQTTTNDNLMDLLNLDEVESSAGSTAATHTSLGEAAHSSSGGPPVNSSSATVAALDDILGLDDMLSAPTVMPTSAPLNPTHSGGVSGGGSSSGLDPFHGLLQPSSSPTPPANSTGLMGSASSASSNQAMGSPYRAPGNVAGSNLLMSGAGVSITPAIASVSGSANKKAFSGNLDETLASLAGSLSLSGGSGSSNKWSASEQANKNKNVSPMMSRPGMAGSANQSANTATNQTNKPADDPFDGLM